MGKDSYNNIYANEKISMTSNGQKNEMNDEWGEYKVLKKLPSEWKSLVMPALLSKVNEFKQIGYSGITIEELWTCLEARIWKEQKTLPIHEVVQDILHLPPSVYISFITIEALTTKDDKADLMESIRALTEPHF